MGDPRRARVGGALVDDGGRGRRRDRPHHRRPCRVREHARERSRRARGCAVGLPLPGRRRRLPCCAGDFPSTIYLLRAQEALGFELTIVPAEADFTVDVRKVVDAIDDATALVAICTCSSAALSSWTPGRSSSGRTPWARRSSSTRTSRLASSQSTSTALGVDFATGGCLKWLRGASGNAFLLHPSRPAGPGPPAVHGLVLPPRAVRVRPRASSRMPTRGG